MTILHLQYNRMKAAVQDMDPNRDKKEHDYVDDEKERAFFASLVNNLKCEVENCTKVNQDNVNTGKHGLGFDNQNDVENPNILKKANGLAPSLYNIDEMEKDFLFEHKIISDKELQHEAKKRLKVKQRKSSLSYHGFIYGLTRFEEPPKVLLKRRKVNLKKHLEQAQLENYDPKLRNNLPMKHFCYVKHSMLNFEKQSVSKQEFTREDIFTTWNHEQDVSRRVRN
ncbi:hypothetical protein Tco_0580558 [Tanacetum coccineum]